ncbi:MAG: histidine kinase [Microthrixaceae bacterium]
MTALSWTNGGRRPTTSDIALAASLLGVAVLSGFFVDANRPDTVEPSAWWHWALMATPAVLVAVRRLSPIPVVVLATVVQSAIWISNLPEVLLPVVVLLFTAASDDDGRGLQVAVLASAVLTIVTGIGVAIADDVTLYQLPLIGLTCGTAIALGVNATRQRHAAAELATQVTEVRLRGERERAKAVAEERSHIARELHDIIGHTLSVIAVRAEAADRVGQRQPAAASEAVTDIAEAARSALNQTRRVLAGLRQSGQTELAPAPDLDATRQLVTDLAKAGIAATLTERGCTDHRPPAVVASGAHRIVQESLTNSVKHGGPGVAIEVQLACSPTELEILVMNSLDASANTPCRDADGTGLTGMAERADILGGTFDAHNDGDRFVVHAVLPNGSPPGNATS